MNRIVAAALAVIAALAVAGVGPPPVAGQPNQAAAVAGPSVSPVFDPGSHTEPVVALRFTPDGEKLVTVGRDHTVRVWAAGTGELRETLRLPEFGPAADDDPAGGGMWNRADVSPDGATAAITGEVRRIAPGVTSVGMLVDIPGRRARRIFPDGAVAGRARRAAFSPDGARLAVAVGTGVYVVDGVRTAFQKDGDAYRELPRVRVPTVKQGGNPPRLAWLADGRLVECATVDDQTVATVWTVPPAGGPAPTAARVERLPGATNAAAATPDGTGFWVATDVRSGPTPGDGYRLTLVPAAGPVRSWAGAALHPQPGPAVPFVRNLAPAAGGAVAVVTSRPLGAAGADAEVWTFDPAAGALTRVAGERTDLGTIPVVAAHAPTGRVAVSTGLGLGVAAHGPGGAAVRFGGGVPAPAAVAWAADPKTPGFVWSEEPAGKPAAFRAGFDLAALVPVAAADAGRYAAGKRSLGGYKLDLPRAAPDGPAARLLKGKEVVGKTALPSPASHGVLVPTPGGPPKAAVVLWYSVETPERLLLLSPGAKQTTRLLPPAISNRALAPSPDGRFLLSASGTPRLNVYPTDGTAEPLVSVARVNGEWVAWTPAGYYAASPGGERMFGWAVNNGPDALATFHPVERFSQHFRRPDVLKLAVETGSVKAALDALGVAARSVAAALPPTARVEVLAQTGGRVRVRATATSPDPAKPVLAMRVMMDGLTLAGGNGVWTPGPGPASAEFEFDLPPRLHDLTVLARNADGSTVSDPVTVRGPRPTGPRPTLYRVCVGVSEYDNTGLRLSNAAQDARDVFAALAAHCAGPGNLYGDATGVLLTDKDATRDRVGAAVAAAAAQSRPGDLVVVFFAGHGKKHGDEYYLYTREADPPARIGGTAVSGADLRTALKDADGAVLLALDACHSAGAASAFRPAVADLTRDLGSSAHRVTVLSAAMADETAGSGKAAGPNGAFTAALLKTLRAGTPFDRVEGAMSVQHLYMAVFDDVRVATNGNQNPFLYRPEAVPAFFVRAAPAGASP